jgi:hypothetical protein
MHTHLRSTENLGYFSGSKILEEEMNGVLGGGIGGVVANVICRIAAGRPSGGLAANRLFDLQI